MISNYDVLIIGGGVIGSSIAYNLMNDGFNGRVAVFEKDPTYEFSSTTLSAGGIRRQFSTARLEAHRAGVSRQLLQHMTRKFLTHLRCGNGWIARAELQTMQYMSDR